MATQYQEGQTATHPDGRKIRYTSGEWVPLTEDGRPSYTPRPEIMTGARELSDGSIVAGRQIIRGAQSGVSPETRSRINLSIGPAVRAQDNIVELEKTSQPYNDEWGAALLDKVPDWGALSPVARAWGGENFQDYDQSVATIEASLLPIFSGLAVTESEAKRFIRANQPQIGDTALTLRDKNANIQSVLNAAASAVNKEIPYPEVGIYGDPGYRERVPGVNDGRIEEGDDGLPSYPGINEASANVAGGYEIGPDGRPIAPAPSPGSPDAPIDISGLSADDLLKLQPGQSIRFPDGRVERLSGAPRIGAGGEEVAPGVYAEEVTPDSAVADRRDDFGVVRALDAGVRGAADILTLTFADEIAAGGDALIGRGAGDTFQDRYRSNLDVQRAIDESDREDVPIARGTGQVAGSVLPFARVGRAAVTAPQALRNAPRAVRGAATLGRNALAGAGISALSAAGTDEGDVLQRAQAGLQAAPVGAAVGGAVAPVASALAAPITRVGQRAARFVGRQAGRAGSALGIPQASALTARATPDPLIGAIDQMAPRVRNVSQLETRANALRAEGIEPALVDTIDSGQRGVMRALATRQTPARAAAQEFAEARAVGMQDRMSVQARRRISDDPRTPQEIRDAAAQQARQEAAPLYERAYAQPFTPTPVIEDLLQRPAGQAALARARRIAANEGRNPDELGLLEDGIANPTMQTMDYVKRGLDDVLESYRDPVSGRLNLDTEGRAVEGIRQQFRNELTSINPTYGEALGAYADNIRLQRAVDIGERFMSMEADDFGRAIATLNPAEQEVARAAARRAVERSAGRQGGAATTATTLSGGREQALRSSALLGEEGAANLQRGVRAERDVLNAAREINPRQGSETSLNLQDSAVAAGAGEVMNDLGRMAARPITGTAQTILRRVQSRGFSNDQAEAIVMAAIDPSRTDELIRLLSQRMTRRQARSQARAIRFALSANAGENSVQ